jgi:formylglycine-generating enzyme required for sulfatase activity
LTGHFQEADGADKLFDTRKMQWQWQKYVSLSQELTTILEKMLQDIPAHRYDSAKEVLAALANAKTRVIPTSQIQTSQNPLKQIFQFISPPTNPPKPPTNINVNINAQSSFTEDLGNGVKLEMIAIPGGTFWMGSPANEAERGDNESPQHQVTVPSFFMGKYPLTQAQYQAIMGKNPAYFKGNNRPVENVSWDDAVRFCQKLSQRTGKNYRLPSEAEWEYACRAGTKTPFSFGDNITTDLVNYDGTYPYKSAPKGKYREQTTDVGTFPPNAFGLYDMHGNVWEWCEDDWHENYIDAPTDGSAWNSQSGSNTKLLRGGSWYSDARYCRSANRAGYLRDFRNTLYGFRVVSSFRTL